MGPDLWDEYVRIPERMTRECLYKFAKTMIILYHGRYLRKSAISVVHQLYVAPENIHGFHRMLGSNDYMHWGWSMCPNS